jgi:hypothetical protein
MGPITFTQYSLEYFAGATLGQLGVEELNPAWNLVIGERTPAVSHHIIRTEDRFRFQHDTGHHQLAPLGVWYSKDCGFANRGMLVKNRLDLAGVDVLAARDNHVLQAVQEVEITVRIPTADVTRVKEAVPQRKIGFLRIFPIAVPDCESVHGGIMQHVVVPYGEVQRLPPYDPTFVVCYSFLLGNNSFDPKVSVASFCLEREMAWLLRVKGDTNGRNTDLFPDRDMVTGMKPSQGELQIVFSLLSPKRILYEGADVTHFDLRRAHHSEPLLLKNYYIQTPLIFPFQC